MSKLFHDVKLSTNKELALATSAQDLAEKICAHLYQHDLASQTLGMRITKIAPGEVALSMRVEKNMVNGLHICHGGLITALADTALAFASNSTNTFSIVAHLSIDFIASAQLNDILTAHAAYQATMHKTSILDVSVHNQDKRLIALLRGRVRRFLDKQVLPLNHI